MDMGVGQSFDVIGTEQAHDIEKLQDFDCQHAMRMADFAVIYVYYEELYTVYVYIYMCVYIYIIEIHGISHGHIQTSGMPQSGKFLEPWRIAAWVFQKAQGHTDRGRWSKQFLSNLAFYREAPYTWPSKKLRSHLPHKKWSVARSLPRIADDQPFKSLAN